MQNASKPVNGNWPLTAMACVAILTVLITGSCRKKTEESLTDKLMKSWKVVQFVDTFYSSYSLAPIISVYEGKQDDYMNFRTDGKLVSSINKTYDSVQYTYSEQHFKLNVREHKYNILTLTNNTMILHEPKYIATQGSTDYSAYRITLKR